MSQSALTQVRAAIDKLNETSVDRASAPARLAAALTDLRRTFDAPRGRAIIDAIAKESNHSEPIVRIAIQDAFDGLTGELGAERLQQQQEVLLRRVASPAHLVFVNLAANVFTACLRPALIASLLGTRVLLRASSRAQTFPAKLAEAFGPAVQVVRFDHEDHASFSQAAKAADVVELFGSDDTLDAIVKTLTTPVIRRGTGIGVVSWNVAPADAQLAALARDVIAYDQRGCLSPRVVIVHESLDLEEAARALTESIDSLNAEFPRAQLDEHNKAEASRWLATGDAVGKVVRGQSCAMVLDESGALSLGPTERHLLFQRALDRALRPWVKVVGSFEPSDERASVTSNVRSDITNAQARWCAAGQMQRPDLFAPADGLEAGAGYEAIDTA